MCSAVSQGLVKLMMHPPPAWRSTSSTSSAAGGSLLTHDRVPVTRRVLYLSLEPAAAAACAAVGAAIPYASGAIAVSDRTRLRRLTQFVSTIDVTHAKPLNIKKMAERAGMRSGVCDNLLQAARKSLILKTERCPSG